MDTASIHRRLLTIVLMSIIIYTQGQIVKVGFGEMDYYAYEHKGGVEITVHLIGMNYEDVPIIVQTLTYDQVEEHYGPINREKLPDPAEYEIGGRQRQDFVNETFYYTFETDTRSAMKEVNFFVQYEDDEIAEKQEGFFVEVSVDESKLLEDRYHRYMYERRLALIMIEDNDEIKVSFQKRSYTVSEDAGSQTNLVAVVKEENRLTEKTLKVMVQASTYSSAIRDEDYKIEGEYLNLIFEPEEQIKYIPFEVIEDSIAELRESFSLFLSMPVHPEIFSLGTIQRTDVYIEDNEEVVVGFEFLTYNVSECEGEDAKVEVCVKLYEPPEVDWNFYITGILTTEDVTATADKDYSPLKGVPIAFRERTCETIDIKNDRIIEDHIETFRVWFELDPYNPPNVVIGHGLDMAEVSIIDCPTGQDIYFVVDTTTSNPRPTFCETIYGVEMITAVINPKNDLKSTRIGSILYPTTATDNTSPNPHNFFTIGTHCNDIVQKYHALVTNFYHEDVSHPYHSYVHGAGTYPAKTLEAVTHIIQDEIRDDNSLANRRRIIVFLTDGGDDDNNVPKLLEAASKLANIPGVTIIAAANHGLTQYMDSGLREKLKEVLEMIATGDSRNVVIGNNVYDMTVDLVKRMTEIGVLHVDERDLIIAKLGTDHSRAYCSCIGAKHPKGYTLYLDQLDCKLYCIKKLDLDEKTCKTPPTCGQIE